MFLQCSRYASRSQDRTAICRTVPPVSARALAMCTLLYVFGLPHGLHLMLLCLCPALAVSLPCLLPCLALLLPCRGSGLACFGGFAVSLPSFCHVVALSLPCLCRVFAVPLPWLCRVVAVFLLGLCSVFVMSLPPPRVVAVVDAVPLPWHCRAKTVVFAVL